MIIYVGFFTGWAKLKIEECAAKKQAMIDNGKGGFCQLFHNTLYVTPVLYSLGNPKDILYCVIWWYVTKLCQLALIYLGVSCVMIILL